MRQRDDGRLPVSRIVEVKGNVRPCVFYYISPPVRGGLGVYGQIRCAQPLDAQHDLRQVGRTLGLHRHDVAPPNALPRQPGGAAQGICAHLGVSKGIAPLVLYRHALGKLLCCGVKEFGQGADVVPPRWSDAPLRQLALFFIQQIVEPRRFDSGRQLADHALDPRYKTLHIPVAQVVAAVAHGERKTARTQLLHNQDAEKNRLVGAVALRCLNNGKFRRAGRRIGQKIDKRIGQKGKIAAFELTCRQLIGRTHMAVKRGVLGADGLKQFGEGFVSGNVDQQGRQRHHGALSAVRHLALAVGHGGKGDDVFFAAHE